MLLHHAAQSGNAEQLRALLAEGMDPDTPDDGVGNAPLHWASSFGHLACVLLLLDSGASVDARNSLGLTPLMRASWKGELAVAELLLERGADVAATNNEKRTALDVAKKPEMQHLLRSHASPDLPALPVSLRGEAFVYLPRRGDAPLVAFATGAQNSPRAVVLVGGLSSGLLTNPWDTVLSAPLAAAGWGCVQPLLSSSYDGWGVHGLRKDAAELAALLSALRGRGVRHVVLVGHSTGCQDAVTLLLPGLCPAADRALLAGIVLHAPVSDREWISTLPDGMAARTAAAQAMVARGEGEQLLPRGEGLPMSVPTSAQRWVDLAVRGGADDMFSSDLSREELGQRLGHVDVRTLILRCGKDECVPAGVDAAALGARLRAAAASGGKADVELVCLEGARHTPRGERELKEYVKAVLGFCERCV